MRFKIYFSIILLSSFLCTNFTFSQGIKLKDTKSFLKHERLSLLGSLGLSTYYGDLCDNFDCMQFRPNFGIGAMYRITTRFSNKTEINYYRLYSDDVHPQRNLNFRSGNVEALTSIVFDVFPYTKHYRKRKLISPYFFVGIGATYFTPKGLHPTEDTWVDLRKVKTENVEYGKITAIIPFGGGIRIKFRKHMEFMLEFGYRKTFTDHLDDVKGQLYLPLSELSPEAQPLSLKSLEPDYQKTYTNQYRGNPDKLDGYFLTTVKVRYILGTTKTHFKGKHPLLKPHHK